MIVLLTDFGTNDPYVGVMKGVIFRFSPRSRIVDLTHGIPPGNVRSAAFVLSRNWRYFPRGAVFVAVVDPGVGTSRRVLCARAQGATFLAPDNGLLSFLEGAEYYAVERRNLFLPEISRTFHGRDIFAPVAARLDRGQPPSSVGPRVSDVIRIRLPGTRRASREIEGEVVWVDRFGNLITSIEPSREQLREDGEIVVCGKHRRVRLVSTYGDARKGELVALMGSSGCLEISVAGGDAAHRLAAPIGARVRLRFSGPRGGEGRAGPPR